MAKLALPKVERVLQERRKRIDANLERASTLKAEAEAAAAAYEETLAKARDAAHEAIREATQKLSQEAATRTASFDQALGEKTKAAEAQIRNAREKAYAEIREVAIEVAEAASTKLIGGEVAKDRIVQAVDSTREKKA